MAAGLATARSLVEADKSSLVLLWTDGRPNSEPQAVAEADLLKSCVGRLVTIGIGADVNENLLRYKIASSPADYYTVDDIQAFAATLHQITELYLNVSG
jgi:hypothetical protein